MESIVIRPLADADLPAITQIYGHYVAHSTATFELDPPGEAEMAARVAAVRALDLPYLVAEQAGTILGFAYAGAYRPRPAYRFTVEDSIYLTPGHTGKGIGHALLTAIIDHCERGPWRQMIAVVGDSANIASVRLHRRLGFQAVGTLVNVGFKFGGWVDTVLLQRGLSVH